MNSWKNKHKSVLVFSYSSENHKNKALVKVFTVHNTVSSIKIKFLQSLPSPENSPIHGLFQQGITKALISGSEDIYRVKHLINIE